MNIKIQPSHKHFSSLGGLFLANQLIESKSFSSLIEPCLPSLKGGKARSIKKFGDMIRGFAAGADCLDDMNRLAKDSGFRAACSDQTYSAKSLGDYLRSFDPSVFYDFNKRLAQFSWALRSKITNKKEVVFDFDSTLNKQYGLKMQGVEFNYQKYRSLFTMNVYDEMGFPYYNDVKPGATHTSNNISVIINHLLSTLKEPLSKKKVRARADSGYCNQNFINACYNKGIEYVVCFRKNSNFNNIVNQAHNWRRCDPKEDSAIVFHDGRECEIGVTNYKMSDCRQRSRIVIIRAKKPLEEGYQDSLVESPDNYDYYAFATNIPEFYMDSKEVIRFYRKRGHAENFIREAKNGFDLKHYPCQKLTANKAYAMIAAFSQSIMRYLALLDNKDKPHFSKAIRNKYIFSACQVVRRGREVFFRFNHKAYEVMRQLMKKISSIQLGFT